MGSIGVLGGDRRQAELARLLSEEGWQVAAYGLPDHPGTAEERERALEAPLVVLPMPLCRSGGAVNWTGEPWPLERLWEALRPGQRIFAGQIPPEALAAARDRGLAVTDYVQMESFAVANAAITAEGAVQTALERLEGTLLGRECLVLGFGRIGRLLSFRLHGLGARVTAAARGPEDRAWIRAYGWEALDIQRLSGRLGRFGAVFNTVPAPVLTGALIAQLPRDCLLVELASRPGLDAAAAGERGLPYAEARGLPGRLAPRAAAEAIRNAVLGEL